MIAALLKFVHIAAIAVWAAGLICLPLLNRQRNEVGEATDLNRLHSMVRFFYVVIVSPAAFIAIGTGTALIFEQETFTLWFSLKLLLVGAFVAIHMRIGHVILRLFEQSVRWPNWRHAAMTATSIAIATAIVTTVLMKPSLDWRTIDSELFEPGQLRVEFDRIVHRATGRGTPSDSFARIDHQADAVIEHQFAAVPTSEAREDRGQHGQSEAVRQNLLGHREPQTPVRTGDREQRHRCDRMRPTTDAAADTLHCQQLRSADERGQHAEPKGEARAPHAGAQEEGVAEKPVEHVDAQRGEH